MEDNNPTTRTYPRTLQEAFPKDYLDQWFDPPKKTYGWMFYVGVCLWVCIAYYFAK
jgi:hypothetical protein